MTEFMDIVAGKSVEELDGIAAALEAERASAKARQLEEVEELANSLKVACERIGIEPRTLFSTRKKAEPKYRNPENAEQIWYGFGKKPAWLTEKLSGVASEEEAKALLESFKIPVQE